MDTLLRKAMRRSWSSADSSVLLCETAPLALLRLKTFGAEASKNGGQPPKRTPPLDADFHGMVTASGVRRHSRRDAIRGTNE